jgi:RNA polymerase sigma factor for flagellar operon FliA
MGVEQFFLINLREIERIIAYVCRCNHLARAEAEEFAAHVKLKLIEANYGVLRKFEGRSTFATYMTTVVQRLFFQYRVQMWGKWRPSAEAKRMGDKGITLERLLTRDGYSFGEAVEILTTVAEPVFTRVELEAMYLRLPPRQPRPVLVSDFDAPDVAADCPDAADQVCSAEREKTLRKIVAVLDSEIASLDDEDRLILQMRFVHVKKVPEIGAALHLEQKRLYKRIVKMLTALRGALEAAGIGRKDIDDLLAHGEHEILLLALTRAEKRATSPSNATDGGFGDGARPPVGLR